VEIGREKIYPKFLYAKILVARWCLAWVEEERYSQVLGSSRNTKIILRVRVVAKNHLRIAMEINYERIGKENL